MPGADALSGEAPAFPFGMGLAARGRIVRARVVGDDLPPKERAHFPKRARLGVAKHNNVFGIEFGIEGDDKLGAVALKCYHSAWRCWRKRSNREVRTTIAQPMSAQPGPTIKKRAMWSISDHSPISFGSADPICQETHRPLMS